MKGVQTITVEKQIKEWKKANPGKKPPRFNPKYFIDGVQVCCYIK